MGALRQYGRNLIFSISHGQLLGVSCVPRNNEPGLVLGKVVVGPSERLRKQEILQVQLVQTGVT